MTRKQNKIRYLVYKGKGGLIQSLEGNTITYPHQYCWIKLSHCPYQSDDFLKLLFYLLTIAGSLIQTLFVVKNNSIKFVSKFQNVMMKWRYARFSFQFSQYVLLLDITYLWHNFFCYRMRWWEFKYRIRWIKKCYKMLRNQMYKRWISFWPSSQGWFRDDQQNRGTHFHSS